MPWIYNEDAALKLKLQGLTVGDATAPAGGRPVPVRYRLPEDELATLTYPCIIIEHAGINPAPEREHRGYLPLHYAPEGLAPWWPAGVTSYDPKQSPYYSWFPLPYNLDYKVTVYSRKMPEHLQPLIAQLAQVAYLPSHFGYLDIPQDGTWRNMFLETGPQIEYGSDKDDKRLFRASYMVRVMTEVIPAVLIPVLINQINLDLGCYADVTDITTEMVAAAQSIISTGPNLAFDVGLTAPRPPAGREEPRAIAASRRRPDRGVWR